MAIKLDGFDLNQQLIWIERHQSQNVAQNVDRLLGGGVVIHSAPLTNGEKITLQATSSTGWLTKVQKDYILSLANGVGTTHVLDYNGTIMNVMFRHNEPPAVDLRPLIDRPVHDNTDYFIGTIKLLKV